MQEAHRAQDVYRYIVERYPETEASRFAGAAFAHLLTPDVAAAAGRAHSLRMLRRHVKPLLSALLLLAACDGGCG
jgi:hypothetical protein